MEKNKLWSLQFVLAVIIGTFSGIAFYIANPVLSKYIIQMGGSSAMAGFVVGLFSVTSLIARPVSGFAADRVDKWLLWIGSTGIIALTSLAYFLCGNVYQIVFFRIFHGLAFAVSSTATIAVITDLVPVERLGEGIGFNSISLVLASAVGPNLSVWIGEWMGLRYSFLAAFGILMVAIILMFFVFTSSRKGYQKKERGNLSLKEIRLDQIVSVRVLPIAITNATFSFIVGILSSFVLLFGESRGITGISLYFTVYSCFLFLSRPLSGKLSDSRYGRYVYYPALFLSIIGLTVLIFAYSLPGVLTAAVFLALGIGSATPQLQSFCIKILGKEKVGLATGTFYLGSDIGQGLGPMFAGVICGIFGYGVLFACCIGVLCIGCAIYTIFMRCVMKGEKNV